MKRKIGIKAKHEKFEDKSLLEMCTSYLISNWYKFDDRQKLTVALPVALKGISDKHEHTGSVNILPPVKLGGKKLDFNVGSRVA